MSYIRLADIGMGQVQRAPSVADKVALTNMVRQIESAQTVKAAWEGYQDVINRMKSLQGWSDSCSSGFFTNCAGGDYDSLARLNERMGQVIGGYTQVMTFAALSEMLTNVRREIAAVRPGGAWDPTESEVARTLVKMLSPAAAVAMYFAKPTTAAEAAGQAQKAYAMWQQLATIARDSGRITSGEYASLRTQADPTFKALGNTVVSSNAAGSAVDKALTSPPTAGDAANFILCLTSSKGPVEAWNCLPTWGKVAVGVAGASAIVLPSLYVMTVFAPAIRAAGNVAERMTRPNGRRGRR